MERTRDAENNGELPEWFTGQLAEFNIDQTWLKVTAADKSGLDEAFQFLNTLKDWKQGTLPASELARIVTALGAKKVTEHLSAIEVRVGLPQNDPKSFNYYRVESQYILPPANQPPTAQEIESLTKTLIDEVSQNYNEKYSILTPALQTEIGGPILDAFVNLAIVIETKEKNQQGFKDKRAVNSHEQIDGKKSEIEISNLFKPIEKEENDSNQGRIPTRLLVEGWAGIGKSVFCQYIANLWAVESKKGEAGLWKGKFDLLLWIPLRNLSTYKQREYSLADVVKADCLPNDSSISVVQIAAILRKMGQRVLLVLDGFDEAVSWYQEIDPAHAHPKLWSYRCQLLRSLIDQKTHPMVVTSRPNFVDTNLRLRFDRRLETIGFKDEDVDKYVLGYFKQHNREELGKLLMAEMTLQPIIREVGHIPVNLSLICLIWKTNNTSFPAQLTLTGLYIEIVLYLLRRDYCEGLKRDGKLLNTGVRVPVNVDDATQESQNWKISHFEADPEYQSMLLWLEEIAWKNQCGSREHSIYIPGKTLIEFLDEKGVHPNQIVDKIKWLKKLGLLNERYADREIKENDYLFPHLTFQEYFAAVNWVKRYLKGETKSQAEEELYRYKYDNRYQIVWRFVVGLIEIREPERIPEYFMLFQRPPMDLRGLRHAILLVQGLNETATCKSIIDESHEIKSILLEYLARCLNQGYPEISVPNEMNAFLHCLRCVEAFDSEIIQIFSDKSLCGFKVSSSDIFDFIRFLPRVSKKLFEYCFRYFEQNANNLEKLSLVLLGLSRKSDDCWNSKIFNQYFMYFCQALHAKQIGFDFCEKEILDWLWGKLNSDQKQVLIEEFRKAILANRPDSITIIIRIVENLRWNELFPTQKHTLIIALLSITYNNWVPHESVLKLIGNPRVYTQVYFNEIVTEADLISCLKSEDARKRSIAINVISNLSLQEYSTVLVDLYCNTLKGCPIEDIVLLLKYRLPESLKPPTIDIVCDRLFYSDNKQSTNLIYACNLLKHHPVMDSTKYYDQLFALIVNDESDVTRLITLKNIVEHDCLRFTPDQCSQLIDALFSDIKNPKSCGYTLISLSSCFSKTLNPDVKDVLASLWSKVKAILKDIKPKDLQYLLVLFDGEMDTASNDEIKRRIFDYFREHVNRYFTSPRRYTSPNETFNVVVVINKLPLIELSENERFMLLGVHEHNGLNLIDSLNFESIQIFARDKPSITLCEFLYRYAVRKQLLVFTQDGQYCIYKGPDESILLGPEYSKHMEHVKTRVYPELKEVIINNFQPSSFSNMLKDSVLALNGSPTLGFFSAESSDSDDTSVTQGNDDASQQDIAVKEQSDQSFKN